jgi:O-antigen/teichoic acid export membrane protein
MKLGRNLVAGLGGSVLTAVVGLAVVPLYLKYLGIEAYGLIGFFATMQALFQLLDMGLAHTLNREIARYSVESKWLQAGNLLHTLAAIYWSIALCIAVIIFGSSNYIATHWVNADKLSEAVVQNAVQLIGISIACRWPIGLYQGALNGLQLNTVTSGVAVAMSVVGGGGAVLLLAFVSATLEVFFVWQACVGLASALALRAFAKKAINSESRSRFDVEEIRRVWRFASGVMIISLSAILFTQVDKVILSKLLSLADFGGYMLATAISGSLYFLIVPLFNVLYPRFSMLVAKGDDSELRLLYRVGMRLVAAVLFPVAFVLVAFSQDIVSVWTGDQALAQSVAPVLSLLSAGTALHCVMYFPYALQLAYGVPRLTLQINLLLIAALVPITIVLALRFGAVGGALAWLVLHIGNVLVGTWLTHRKLLKEIGVQWLMFDVVRPLVIAGFVVFTARYIVSRFGPTPPLSVLVFAACAGLAAILLGLAASPQACRLVMSRLQARHAAS